MLYIILLAAGYSRRFDGNKLLHLYQDRPLYLHVLEKLEKLKNKSPSDRELIVVTQYDEIVIKCTQKNIISTINKADNTGIASSIKSGLREAESRRSPAEKACYYLFCVADQPAMKVQTLEQLIAGFQSSHKGIGCIGYQENGERRLGNPVIFHSKYQDELQSLKEEEGGKVILKKYPEDVYIYQAAHGAEFRDIDSKNDL